MDAKLSLKLNQATLVLEDALTTYQPDRLMLAWSAGKDSTLVLKLMLDVCRVNGLNIPTVIDIDQNDQFEELISFRNKLANEWKFDIIELRNDDFISKAKFIGNVVDIVHLNDLNQHALTDINYTKKSIVWEPDSPTCNHLLKTVPMQQALIDMHIEALITGIRWDEHPARHSESYFSERNNPPHTRIHPILHFTERDIWDTHFALGIPFCSLYKDGYRSLGTKSGTHKNSTTPAWEQDLHNERERASRHADKESVMAQLRKWGYM